MIPPKPKIDKKRLKPTSAKERMALGGPVEVVRRPPQRKQPEGAPDG